MARLVVETLLAKAIDFAGTFPPADLTLSEAVAQYKQYLAGPDAWMLGRFVVAESDLPRVPTDLDGRLAIVADHDLPRASAIEAKSVIRTPKPTYCEVATSEFDNVVEAGSFAKLRLGGITADAIPDLDTAGIRIVACARRGLPFKATAGLHHPLRAEYPLTYELNAPRAVLHGFMNVFAASAFAWLGQEDAVIPVLAETDPDAFRFHDGIRWRDERITLETAAKIRRSGMHSFGSCSFEEPVADLRRLGWL